MPSSASSRRCARPTCTRGAVATLSYAYGASTVWVDDLSPTPHPMTHDLCELHADRLCPPRGWEIRDRRRPAMPELRSA